MSDRFSLDGRVAVITGGGTGIGRGTALVLAEHGADIVLAARRREPLEATAKEIRALGRRALAVPTDVSDPDQCRRLVDTTLGEMGRIDILVNNAGGAQTKSPMKWTDEEWQHVLALNLGSVFFLSRAAAEPMLAQGKGAIVNISSGASLLAMPQAAPYGAAKAGVNNLTGSLAAAWTRKGVRVNTIAVGAVRAATLLDEAERHGLAPEAIAMTNGSHRLGEPDEIGYGVLFFASDASSFCSGQTLYIHGGPGPAGI
jgi:NAD(P)-dependent dehydrogenase (short-subunit alcohol dehydrogenase family)